jgi:hypothetical protein
MMFSMGATRLASDSEPRRRTRVTLVVGLGLVATLVALGPATARGGARATLSCDGRDAAHLKHVAAPRNCEILYPNLSLLDGLQLERLRWSHWGSDTATATGITHGFHLADKPTAIHVRIWRLRHTNCTGGPWYTRLRVKGAFGYSKTFHTDYC